MTVRAPLLLLLFLFIASIPAEAAIKPRLVILTDIGGDPDDQQSMVRLMTYANEFEIEGLIASASGTPGELKENVVRPDLIREIVAAYGKVRDNLLLHNDGYPTEQHLLDRIKSGNPHRGRKNLGAEHDTEGSNWIIEVVDRPDKRSVNIAIWGGATELAQALWRVREDRSREELQKFIGKLRVHSITHQDDTGPWIVENFPSLFFILNKESEGRDRRESAFRGMYLGGDESLTSLSWLDQHVRKNHGPLGALYPPKTWTAPNPEGALKEGDSPSWLYFLPNGLSDPAHPEWGGWGGRFEPAGNDLYRDAKDTVGKITDARATVWRWRPAFQADFQARMDWCVRPFDGANHAPVAILAGDKTSNIVRLVKQPGDTIALDAAGSKDPDGNRLSYGWWIYAEAGTHEGRPAIENDMSAKTTLTLPADSAGKQMHVILEVADDGSPSLTRYRRIVIDVPKVTSTGP